MKKHLFLATLLASFSAFADTPTLQNLTKSDAEKVSNEFAMNFSHTAVAAPETNGAWGIEVGLIGGQTPSPNLKRVINTNSPGDGDDFKNIYHAGLMARAHFPYEIFVEGTILPERDISDVKVSAQSLGLGWNAGSFFGLPLDVALGANISSSDVSYKQTMTTPFTAESKIAINSSTQVLWAGVSKTFWFFTPYAKIGKASSDSDIKSSFGSIFASGEQKMSVDSSGGYWAVGGNFEFFFFKFGVETSEQASVRRTSAKFSLDF